MADRVIEVYDQDSNTTVPVKFHDNGDGTYSEVVSVPGGSGGGGQTTYDAVVAATGGDYTTLTAALAAASAGWRIFIKAGTYAETFTDFPVNNLIIEGAGENAVTLNMSNGNVAVSTGTSPHLSGVAITNCQSWFFNTDNTVVSNVKYTNNTYRGTIGGSANYQNWTRITYNSTATTAGNHCFYLAGEGCTASDITITATGPDSTPDGSMVYFSCNGGAIFNVYCSVVATGTITGAFALFVTNGSLANVYVGDSTSKVTGLGYQNYLTATGLNISGCKLGVRNYGGGHITLSDSIITPANLCTGISVTAADNSFSNVSIVGSSATTGISIASDTNIVTGCRINGCTTGINVASGTNNVLVGNNTQGSTTGITDSGTTTVKTGNV